MKKMKIIVILLAIAIAMLPITSCATPVAESNDNLSSPDTATLMCSIAGKKVDKELPVEQIEEIMELGNSCSESFLTIYNKFSTEAELEQAFDDVQPFFQALADAELTEKTPEEMTELYQGTRGKIRMRNTGKGLWNGVPTPVMLNVMCGIVAVGTLAVGYAIGTHTLLPTVGLDLLVTAEFTGESSTVGLFGWTQQALLQTFIAFGFVGILLGVYPSGVIIGNIFMTGFAVIAGVIGLTPF